MAHAREIDAVRNNFGIWASNTHTVLRFSGRDAATWLHAQTTNQIVPLNTGEGSQNALLDRTGRMLAVFTVYRWEDELWLLVPRAEVGAVMARVDSHLFLEEVQVEDVGAEARHIHVEGPRTLLFLDAIMGGGKLSNVRSLPERALHVAPVRILGLEVLAFRETFSGEDGYRLVPGPGEDTALLAALLDHAPEFLGGEISHGAVEALRIEAGYARYGTDVGPEQVINETPFEASAVAYDKGCYLGQEVVTRLKTYGSPKIALTGLLSTDPATTFPAPGTPLLLAGERIGEMRSNTFSPTLSAWIALAYLDRNHRAPGTELSLSGAGMAFTATVHAPPFVQLKTRHEYAHALYDEALGLFEQDANDEDDSAITLLKQCLVLAPAYEDAYEALGVILHRHHRVDEAIHYMKLLAKLNPNCVMAHTNLSVFYVSKGMITEAESEKALANQLEFKRQLDARDAEKMAAEERTRIRREAEEKIVMFKEVLEIDVEDPIATMGLGASYMQLDQYAEAIPYLETAVRVKKDYSAAFLNLGKCHEFLGHRDEARTVYHSGIEAAARKGDLMPLREMERRLKGLD